MKRFLIIVLLLFAVVVGATPDSRSEQNEKRDAVVQTYLSQVGVREATGHNDGIEVEMYLASTDLGAGYAWCAAFVNWVYEKNEVDRPAKGAWSPAWFPASRLINTTKQTPQAGDLFGLYYTRLKRIGHVGFIHEWGDTYTVTVEGNTNNAGSREGDGVYKETPADTTDLPG